MSELLDRRTERKACWDIQNLIGESFHSQPPLVIPSLEDNLREALYPVNPLPDLDPENIGKYFPILSKGIPQLLGQSPFRNSSVIFGRDYNELLRIRGLYQSDPQSPTFGLSYAKRIHVFTIEVDHLQKRFKYSNLYSPSHRLIIPVLDELLDPGLTGLSEEKMKAIIAKIQGYYQEKEKADNNKGLDPFREFMNSLNLDDL